MKLFFEKALTILNSPLLAWVLIPLVYIIPGSIIGQSHNGFHFYPFFLLYTYLVLMVLLEKFLIKTRNRTLDSLPAFKATFVLMLNITFILFGAAVNWIALTLLILYVAYLIFIYRQTLYMEQTPYYLVLHLFFQVFIFNVVAFYAQTNFVSTDFLPYLLPVSLLLLPLIFTQQNDLLKVGTETTKYQLTLSKYIDEFNALSYLLGVIATFIAFHISNTSIERQVGFGAPLLILFILSRFNFLKMKISTQTFLHVLVFFSVLLYSMFLKKPF